MSPTPTLFIAFSDKLEKFKFKIFRWLDNQLILNRIIGFQKQSLVDPTAVLGPECKIENIRRSPQFIEIGAHSYIRGRLLTYAHGGQVHIGSWCYVGLNTEIWSMDSILIGDRVLIAHGVNIHDGTAHSLNALERHRHFKQILETGHPKTSDELPGVSSAPIIIEDDAWISFGVTILKGVRIGARSIIAAGSIVTQDVPPDSIYRCEITPVITPMIDRKL